ncbi:DUF6340 family protein [Bacteroides sp. 519]|uniref:DUF6340 family protein n=1 Tax=Bacteroides sp. 519 TaxID=2302937 RepID=UPI0013CF5808|nr:DUF6340 family protein [Bacteroides sp. 519]NDV58657.1 tetratricopeptide repeat protein [Bacteroides sp. 519]
MKTYYTLIAICLLAFASCQSLEVITIDQLVPSDLSFPESIKRVGIVNNVNVNAPDNNIPLASDTTKHVFEIARKVTFHDGDAKLATESLAETVAEANYFDEVIISDSTLRANDIRVRQTTLSQIEVNDLTEELDVDMIIALESIQLKAIRSVSYFIEGGYLGTVDVKMYPNVTLYLPNRKAPLASVNATDSIFWEGVFATQVRAQTQVISDSKIIEEASALAGTLPVKHILPYWKTVERVYYTSNKADMKDASRLVKRGMWDEAFNLWSQIHQSKKAKDQMVTALNIALYYEVKDDLDQAILWGEKALTLAKKIDKIDDNQPIVLIADSVEYQGRFQIAYLYLEALKQRKELSTKLNMQMKRFEEE